MGKCKVRGGEVRRKGTTSDNGSQIRQWQEWKYVTGFLGLPPGTAFSVGTSPPCLHKNAVLLDSSSSPLTRHIHTQSHAWSRSSASTKAPRGGSEGPVIPTSSLSPLCPNWKHSTTRRGSYYFHYGPAGVHPPTGKSLYCHKGTEIKGTPQ